MNPSKLLFFGEYAVLFGSDCLAIPYKAFYGELTVEQPDAESEKRAIWSNRQLMAFNAYLQKQQELLRLTSAFDTELLSADIARGLWYRSTIPGQSGLGSSGALVASLIERYLPNLPHESIDAELKNSFALMESFFHGNSSGIDPLVSYVQRPVAIVSKQIHFPDISAKFPDELKLFLVRTNEPRNTKALVEQFTNLLEDSDFKQDFQNEVLAATNDIIKSMLDENADHEEWVLKLKNVSQLQLKFFATIIPKTIAAAMQYGLDTGLFTLKLLGSGGGFMIGFTYNLKETIVKLNEIGLSYERQIKISDLELS